MKHKVFAIHDSKAGAFLPPFILPRVEIAIRTFQDCIAATDHQFSKHPEDYNLFTLGEWSDDSGMYDVGVPELVVTGLESVNPEIPDTETSQNGTGRPVCTDTSSDDPTEQL